MSTVKFQKTIPEEQMAEVQTKLNELAEPIELEVSVCVHLDKIRRKKSNKEIVQKLKDYIRNKNITIQPKPRFKLKRRIPGDIKQIWLPYSIWQIIITQVEANSDIVNKAIDYEDQSNAEHRS